MSAPKMYGLKLNRNSANAHLHDTATPPKIGWVDVASTSKIRRIRYDSPGSQDFLDVEFEDGRISRFTNVPWSVWHQFLSSGSKGSFLYRVLRNNGRDDKYPAYYI